MKTKIVFIILLSYILFFTGVITASADSIFAPEPYSIILEGGNKIVYITPTGGELDERNKNHPRSGLYYNEDPLRNIYYFDDYLQEYYWYLQGASFVISDNGIFVALIPWAQNRSWAHQSRQFKNTTDGEAIILYKNGDLFKSFTVGNLIKDETKVEFSESHVEWEIREKRNFDADKNILTVTTKDNIVVSIDIASEEMIEQIEVPAVKNYFVYAIIGAGLFCIIAFGLIILFKHRKMEET